MQESASLLSKYGNELPVSPRDQVVKLGYEQPVYRKQSHGIESDNEPPEFYGKDEIPEADYTGFGDIIEM